MAEEGYQGAGRGKGKRDFEIIARQYRYQNMNKLYILGAGASLDFWPKDLTEKPKTPLLPTSNNFLNKIIGSGVFNKLFIEAQIQKFCMFLKDTYGISYITSEEPFLNIEKMYCDIETEILKTKWTSGRLNLYLIERMLSESIEELISKLCRQRDLCRYHEIFARQIIEEEANIISFNWDILMDEALYNTGQWFYHDGYWLPFFRMYRDGYEFKESGKSKCYLLKPHGSLNWFRYNEYGNKIEHQSNGYPPPFTNEDITYEELKQVGFFTFSKDWKNVGRYRPPDKQRLERGRYYNPKLKTYCVVNIVPPGMKRYAFSVIWDKITNFCRQADEIVIIGFSFNNDYDNHVTEELKRIKFKQNVKICIVNPLNGVEFNKLIDRYKGIFDSRNIEKICDTFSEYCKYVSSNKNTNRFSLTN